MERKETSAQALPSAAGDNERARTLVLRYGWNSVAYQILNPGIEQWFAPEGDAVVGYVNAGRRRVVAGAPVCPTERLLPVVEAFEAEARRAGQQVCYFGAQDRLTDLLVCRHPVARLLLGAQPVWDPAGWDAIVATKASLRAQLARARNKGVVVARWPAEQAEDHPRLRRCLQEWLERRGLPPMRFLVEPQTLGQLADRRVLVAERGGAVVGYLVASPVPLRRGWLVEQIIRGTAVPNGTAELLLDAAMRDAAADGCSYVTLGLSPLSRYGPPSDGQQPLSIRLLLGWVRAHCNRFYNFAGLEQFKAKLQPACWEPVYAVSNEATPSFGTLYAIAWAFGGMPPARFVSRALLRALLQEVRWLAAMRPALLLAVTWLLMASAASECKSFHV